jgi:amino acid transporter
VGIVVLAVVWLSAALSLLRMRVTQNYVNVQFFFYAAAIFVIGLAGVVWLLKGNPSATDFGTGWDPFAGEDLALGLPSNLTFFTFAILALLGIETPLNMGVEVTGGEKAIRTYLLWGCLIVMAAYLWTTWGNMVTIEAGGANTVTGGVEAVGVAIGEWAGVIVALILAWVFFTATVVYNYAFARLLFVSGLEKRLPHQFGKVNKNQVPANAVIMQTVIATIITIFMFFGITGDDYNVPFYALYGGLTIVWCISTGLLFLDIFFAKRANPERFERERRVPAWWLYLCGGVGAAINLFAIVFIFVGSWYPAGFETLAEWNAWMFGISGISVLAGILIYVISQRTRRGKTDEELIELGEAEREISEDMPKV